MKLTNEKPGRLDQLFREENHDPYVTRLKPREPTVCPVCRAVFLKGHWQWKESWPLDSCEEMCPACQRVRDHNPSGVITVKGAFAQEHKAELLALLRHHEEAATRSHPLHRIMSIDERPEQIVITTTDIHLPRRIGDALHDAFKGHLHIHYDEDGCLVRIGWTRES